MSEFVIRVGLPEEDAHFIKSGATLPEFSNGRSFRKLCKEFSFLLPVPEKGPALISFLLSAGSPEYIVQLKNGDTFLLEINTDSDAWKWHSFNTGSDDLSVSDNGFIVINGSVNIDPMYPPSHEIRLSEIKIEYPEESELSIPNDFTDRKIRQLPVKIPAMYRSYHEIRKLASVYSPAPDTYKYSGERNIYFGDVHVHTNFSHCGYPYNGTVYENACRAKEAGLDFIAVTDHAEHMNDSIWNEYFEAIKDASERSGLLILPAVEWTSFDFGHRNVYFRNTLPGFFSSNTHHTDSPSKLADLLTSGQIDAFAGPHHPAAIEHLTDPSSIDERLEKLVEIYSTWGNSEYYGAPLQTVQASLPGCTVRDMLAKGYKLGFMGGGDCHNTMPGSGGLTAVLADELTVESIYDSMKRRACYAVANDRIMLDFHINGFPMGSIININQYTIDKLFPLEVAVSVICTESFEKLELICNGEVIFTKTHRENKTEADFYLNIDKYDSPDRIRNTYGVHTVNCSRYYYIRVTQLGGSIAWSSPIWIDYRK